MKQSLWVEAFAATNRKQWKQALLGLYNLCFQSGCCQTMPQRKTNAYVEAILSGQFDSGVSAKMIDATHDLSIRRQTELIEVSRSNVYYLPRPAFAADPVDHPQMRSGSTSTKQRT
jgi:hypothetical protein